MVYLAKHVNKRRRKFLALLSSTNVPCDRELLAKQTPCTLVTISI